MAEEVKKIAKLSRIELSEKEEEKIKKDISNILDYFSLLSEVDVSNVEPFSFSFLKNALREDLPDSPKEEIINDFPERKGRYLKVKEIF